MTEPTTLYRYFDHDGQLLYVGITVNFENRRSGHCAAAWYPSVASVTLMDYPSREDALRAEWESLQSEQPIHNRQRGNGYIAPASTVDIDMGARVARLLRQRGIPRRRVPIARTTLDRRLSGQSSFNVIELALIAELLGMRVSELVAA